MMISFLQQGLVADQIVKLAEFTMYDPKTQVQQCMEIDGQALKHLELLELEQSTEIPSQQQGTLFTWLDRTKSLFGRRMLKKWLSAPLFDVDRINSRLDAVEDLMRHPEVIQAFQDKLKQVSHLTFDL